MRKVWVPCQEIGWFYTPGARDIIPAVYVVGDHRDVVGLSLICASWDRDVIDVSYAGWAMSQTVLEAMWSALSQMQHHWRTWVLGSSRMTLLEAKMLSLAERDESPRALVELFS
jgi:hypothetical protein